MNFVKLKGNLARDIDLRMLGANGTPKCTTTIAVSEEYNGKKITNYIPIEAWRETADVLSMYQKGQEISVIGKIVTGSYEKDGQKVYTWGVNVNKIETAGERKAETNVLNDIFPDATVVDEDDLPF